MSTVSARVLEYQSKNKSTTVVRTKNVKFPQGSRREHEPVGDVATSVGMGHLLRVRLPPDALCNFGAIRPTTWKSWQEARCMP